MLRLAGRMGFHVRATRTVATLRHNTRAPDAHSRRALTRARINAAAEPVARSAACARAPNAHGARTPRWRTTPRRVAEACSRICAAAASVTCWRHASRKSQVRVGGAAPPPWWRVRGAPRVDATRRHAGLLVCYPFLPTLMTDLFASRAAGTNLRCASFPAGEAPSACVDAHAQAVAWCAAAACGAASRAQHAHGPYCTLRTGPPPRRWCPLAECPLSSRRCLAA